MMSEILSTRCGSEGTKGISGGCGEEDEYYWWVLWEFFIIFQKILTGGNGLLTSGYNGTGLWEMDIGPGC